MVVKKSDAESDADRAQNDDERALLTAWRRASESARCELLAVAQRLAASQETPNWSSSGVVFDSE
jgi:hypothetical protein